MVRMMAVGAPWSLVMPADVWAPRSGGDASAGAACTQSWAQVVRWWHTADRGEYIEGGADGGVLPHGMP